MTWRDGRHPVWSILRSVVLMTGAIVILDHTAAHFDRGEVAAAGGVAVPSIAYDIVKKLLAQG
jgi:hypothetical protein